MVRRPRESAEPTFYFGVGTLLSASDVDKIKEAHGLCKARSKLPNDTLIFDGSARARGLRKTRKIGDELGVNVDSISDTKGDFTQDSLSQGIRGLFTTFAGLLNKSFLKLGTIRSRVCVCRLGSRRESTYMTAIAIDQNLDIGSRILEVSARTSWTFKWAA